MNKKDTLTLADIDRAVEAATKEAPIMAACRCQRCSKEWYVTIPRCESCDPQEDNEPTPR